MKKFSSLFILLGLSFFSLSSCKNYLDEFAKKTSDEAIFEEGKQLVTAKSWTAAITKFSELSTAYAAKREVVLWRASAYAGRCGMEFLSMASSLQNIGSTNLLLLLLQSVQGASTSEADDCITAESLIHSNISASATSRTADENIFMAFLSMAKIGSILAAHADGDGDGVPNWGNDDSCNTGNLPESAGSEYAQHVATGIAILSTSIQEAGAISGVDTSALSNLCGETEATFCSDTDVADIDALELRGVRTIIQEGAEGIGLATCTDGTQTYADCLCP